MRVIELEALLAKAFAACGRTLGDVTLCYLFLSQSVVLKDN
jgi:hypothetical protein